MRERYSFRFTHEEIAEMRRVLEGYNHSRPPQTALDCLALSFSNVRRQQGMTCVRIESIQSWFKRNRRGHTKAGRGRPPRESKTSTQAAQPTDFTNHKATADEESSGNSSLEDESSDEEMSGSTSTEKGRSESNIQNKDVSHSAECKDVSLQPELTPHGPLSEVDTVLARLAKYKKVGSELDSNSMLGKPSDLSTLSTVGRARAILGKLKGLSLVEFKSYEEDFKFAIQTLLEEGGFLLGPEKAELSVLPDKLLKIYRENNQVRKELADCRAFMEKLEECKENTIKLMEKAKILEERHMAFPHDMPTHPNKIDGVEAVLHHDMVHAEKIKCDKENVAIELTRIAECLQSSSTHYTILKAEEASVNDKMIKLAECLQKNTREWVKLTDSKILSFL